MTFSIVIPTYNGAKYLRQAINSALNQTRPADEIIISDDNSSDNTVEIAKEYGNQVKVFQNPKGPSGFVNGWNNAIALASGKYITILHQDDTLEPTFLQEVETALKKYPDSGHIFVPCNYIDSNGNEIQKAPDCDGSTKLLKGEEYIELYLFHGNPHIHRCPGVVTRKDLFEKCEYREEAGHIADDDFFMRIGNYTDVIGIMKPLASYRIHGESETGHLTSLALEKRLAKDWHFQKINAKNNPLITSKIYNRIKQIAKGDARHVVGLSIKTFSIRDFFWGLRYYID